MGISMQRATVLAALVGLLGGCSKGADPVVPTASPPQTSAAATAPAGVAAAGAADSSAAVVPGPADAGPEGFSATGTIVDKIDLDESKTMYVQVNTGSNTVWVATKQIDVVAGDRVKVTDAMEMRDFASPSLGRSFEVLWMASEIEKLP